MVVAKSHQDQLPRIKKEIRKAHDYFKDNYKRFNRFRKFIFETSLDDRDIAVLKATKKPVLEFNILEAYVSRLRGEFSRQEPSVKVTAAEGAPVDPQLVEVVEGHLRHIESESNANGCDYNIYTDLLSGGYSAIKVWTEYSHPMSMDQVIKYDRVFDPTLVGWDPLAHSPSKKDGRYCFELYPRTKEEFSEEFPDIDIKKLKYSKELEGFSWSYKSAKDDLLLVCDYYEKKKKSVRIVKLSDGKVIRVDEYDKYAEDWNASGRIEAAPVMVGNPRWTEIESICRYRLIETEIIEYKETDFSELPIVFVDGNSEYLRDTNNGSLRQMTRPYVYHAEGIQKLKNFAGQTLANELENMIQHKFIFSKESLPDEKEYLDMIKNVQQAGVVVYNELLEQDPNVRLTPPREVSRVPAPPEVTNTFTVTDQMTQTILGSYDAAMGIQNNQLSGTAIENGAMNSNMAADPWVVKFLLSKTQVYRIIVDLLPKYYKMPRVIPTISKNGDQNYVPINQQPGMDFDYDSNALNVRVEAGVNFHVQKSRALQQIIGLSQASQIFSQFLNESCLDVLVDNLEVHGADTLKERSKQFMQGLQQQKQQAMQMQQQQMQNNPQMIVAQTDRMRAQSDAQIKAAEVAIKKQVADDGRVKTMAEIQNQQLEAAVSMERSEAEKARSAVDMAIKVANMSHNHSKEHHEVLLKHDDMKLKFHQAANAAAKEMGALSNGREMDSESY